MKLRRLYTPRLIEAHVRRGGLPLLLPHGQTEAAVIHLSDRQSETFYSLVVHPLTGRVSVKNRTSRPTRSEQVDDRGKAIVQ